MPKTTLRGPVLVALAVGDLPLLAACGGSSGSGGTAAAGSSPNAAAAPGAANADPNASASADAEMQKDRLYEDKIADCMRKKGFTYTPHPDTEQIQPQDQPDPESGEDYAAAKQYRQKYGFGIGYAPDVYPDDPLFAGEKAKRSGSIQPTVNPDTAGLSPAQLNAYNYALMGAGTKVNGQDRTGGCSLAAQTSVYGPPSSQADQNKAGDETDKQNKANGLILNGDPQLVQLAHSFASCLSGKGVRVTSNQPGDMLDMVQVNFTESLPSGYTTMSKEEATPRLAAEIHLALTDLECGKDFRAAYFPKEKAHPYWGNGQ